MNTPSTDFSEDEKVARELYRQFENVDPFTSIDRSLLSAADIYDYSLQTGMIFTFNEKYLKAATYVLTVVGHVFTGMTANERNFGKGKIFAN